MWRRYFAPFLFIYTIGVIAAIASGRPAVMAGLLLLSLIAFAVAFWYVEVLTERPLRRFRAVVKRLQTNDPNARALSDVNSEAGQTIRAFNDWHAQQRYQKMEMMRELDRLRTVFEQMSDGVIITTTLGDVHSINNAALRLFELKRGEELGQGFVELVRHHQIIELWQRALETESVVSNVVEIGRTRLFLKVSVTPLFESQNLVNFAVLLSDLTTVRRLETVRRDFISNISHELRTPIASMRAVIETLQDGALDDPPIAQKFLSRAEGEADKMTQMIEELMELSRIESGRVPLRIVPIQLASVVESAIERLQAQATRGSVSVKSEIGVEPLTVYIDPTRVEQVITNLIHNAIKFTPPDGKVRVSSKLSGDFVAVSVQDSGVGIPAHALPRIFERFYKIDQARSSRGTGLGLSIAKHIVQIHGGEIRARSRVDKGSTFTFTLPIIEPEVGAEPYEVEF